MTYYDLSRVYLLLFSLAPIVVFLVLLLVKKTSLLGASLVTLFLVFLTTFFYWQIFPIYIVNSLIKGFLVAFDIMIIILGAIFFLEILQKIGIIENLCFRLESFSRDIRIQVIILAWFLENFIEGTAGFGTPSAVVAPILVGLGLTPLAAAIMGLLGNSASVAFGAAGTPIRVGFAGLDITQIPLLTVLINSVGLLVPVFMLWVLSKTQINRKKFFWEALPFALWCGVAFVVPSILVLPLGQEFPSILGSVFGLILVLITTKLGIFVPKQVQELRDEYIPRGNLSTFKVFFPYVFLILLLLAGKFAFGNVSLPFALFGKQYAFNLFNPGFAFILAGLPVAFVWGEKKLTLNSFTTAAKRTLEPFLVILAMSVLVQLMVNSGHNNSGIPSALEYLSRGLATSFLPLAAPFVGAFGSFLTGSATVSNIMFGNFLSLASTSVGVSAALVLALELSGAAAGNMIALADILSAEAVLGLKNKEKEIITGVFWPCLIYVTLIGLVGMIIAYYQ